VPEKANQKIRMGGCLLSEKSPRKRKERNGKKARKSAHVMERIIPLGQTRNRELDSSSTIGKVECRLKKIKNLVHDLIDIAWVASPWIIPLKCFYHATRCREEQGA
jgi:hypothetical protein